ncbi:MAG TPA: S-adenosylmethionine:tRNA ribosyltransferase-isomerase, partial [Acidimicrobiales bacterium]|nr:S-adenosylmethionine:tRNA ribosyltransferase-isomerase [Acidimicrobiales bacterium]
MGENVVNSFDYSLPPAAIAQVPAEPRDAARLLVATDPSGAIAHRRVSDLSELLEPGDLLVVNETRVLPARLALRKQSGGQAEVLLLEPTSDGEPATSVRWRALVRPGRRLQTGAVLVALNSQTPVVRIGPRLEGGCREVELLEDPWPHGAVPLPPYIEAPLADPERYQTVYGTRPASVAAPTAGLHFTERVLADCRARGVTLASVELVVGLDTFRPITVEDPADHVMHSERYRVPASTMAAVGAANRVVAVGTTTVRALESAAASGELEGRTSLFIRGDYPFAVVDVLLTNFHMPRSSLLLLVDAFCGPR